MADVSSSATPSHFEDREVQAHAARFGMWVFLCSEILLFSGLFALFAASRAADPAGFHAGIEASEKVLGTINTCILLTSSVLVALAVRALEDGAVARSKAFLGASIALGCAFLLVKGFEYHGHWVQDIRPDTSVATSHGVAPMYWSLYYVMTGIHAVHVVVGLGLLAWSVLRLQRGSITKETAHRLEVVGMYWHLVDVIWIFLWPLLYLA